MKWLKNTLAGLSSLLIAALVTVLAIAVYLLGVMLAGVFTFLGVIGLIAFLVYLWLTDS